MTGRHGSDIPGTPPSTPGPVIGRPRPRRGFASPRTALALALILLGCGVAVTLLARAWGWGWSCGMVAAALGLGLLPAMLLGRVLVTVVVSGMSMEPTYHDGDRVLVRRSVTPNRGDVVVVERPEPPPLGPWRRPPIARTAGATTVGARDWLIKRVAAVPGDPVPRHRLPILASSITERVPPGQLVLLGDNQCASFDSRQIGYFPVKRVLGAVVRPPL